MRKVVVCVGLMVMLAIANHAFATTTNVVWGPTAGDGNWNNGANWVGGTAPIAYDSAGTISTTGKKAVIKTAGVYPAFTTGTGTADILVTGGGTSTNFGGFEVNGATINVSEYITLAAAVTDFGRMTMTSGTVSVGVQIQNQPFYVTQLGTGVLNMNGGTIYVGNYLTPTTPLFTGTLYMTGITGSTGSGTLNLAGGNIYANDLLPGTSGTARSLVVTNGNLWLKTDRTTEINSYVTAGWLTAGSGYTLHVDGTSFAGLTKVYATIPEPATVCLLGLGAMGLLRRRVK